MKIFRFLLVFFLAFPVFLFAAGNDLRTIAILENERMLDAEPDVRLVTFFQSKDPAIRARSILASGRIGNKAVIGDLCRHASDPDLEVRKMTAFALGQIRAKEGFACLPALLKDADSEVRRLAIEGAGRIGGLESTSLVLPFLEDSSPALREQAGLALALIKDKASVEVLMKKVSVDDPAQWSYASALYRLADERSIPSLHAILANPSPSPSTGDPSSLLFALKALWGMKKKLTKEETDKLLQHADPRVQQNALDVLAASGDKDSCDSIRSRMESFSLSSRWKAVETLGALECATVDEKMKYLGSAEPVLRAAGLKLISKAEAERYVSGIDRAARDESYVVRSQAAQSAAALGPDSALPILKRMLNDTDSAVRLAAVESLGAFLPATEELMLPIADGPDSAARSIVLEALAQTRNSKYLPVLLKAFEANTDLDTRGTVVDALADSADSRALGVMQTALASSNATLRKRAVDALKKMSGPTLFLNGKAVDADSFLVRSGKVTQQTIASYPPDYGKVPDREAVLKLEKGDVRIRLLGSQAPVHVANFIKLAEQGFYNGLRIHRVVPGFVIQGGDPRGDGWGGNANLLPDQFNRQQFLRGKIGMPTSGKDTGGSQFFITMSRQPHLDANYTIFGEVISGMEIVDSTTLGDRIISVQLQ